MKKIFKQFSQFLGTPAALLAATLVSAQAASETADTNSAPVVIRKSFFDDNLKSGKDPFFPKSTRRDAKLPAVNVQSGVPVIELSLKGISGPANRRFALINNRPLAEGETGLVRIAGGQVNVHCWEIREDSVVVSVEGNPEKKELRLREGR